MNFYGVTVKDENERANFFEMKSKNHWLLLVFFVYLSNLVLFSLIYTWLYRSNSISFLFNSDIVTAKNFFLKKESVEEIASSHKVINYIRLVSNALTNKDFKLEKKLLGVESSLLTEGNITFRFVEHIDITGPEWPTGIFNLEVIDKNYNKSIVITLAGGIPNTSYVLPENKKELSVLIDKAVKEQNEKIDAYKKIITSIDRDKITPWGYLDFFYFSCITQSTVGYGDIIPNTTTARLIISLQTIIGTLLLGVFINFSLKE
ncbi:potassium channel family protein [Candidatus Electronema sp. PJ]|uniref:potassium channel family protein n=1 Tax=Candidatus Electronema sp. PJ TaxID=3401572 RepID=UPI003AA7D5C2